MGDKYKVQIDVIGCDDSTCFDMWVTKEEHEFLLRVAAKTEEVSTYGCMPVIKINDGANEQD